MDMIETIKLICTSVDSRRPYNLAEIPFEIVSLVVDVALLEKTLIPQLNK